MPSWGVWWTSTGLGPRFKGIPSQQRGADLFYPLWSLQAHLVGGWPTPLKNMTSSVGMMTFPIYGKIKAMFQTTNQVWMMWCFLTKWSLKLVPLRWCDGVTKLRVKLKRQKLKCSWTKERSYQRETIRRIWDWSDRNGDTLSGCSHYFNLPFIFSEMTHSGRYCPLTAPSQRPSVVAWIHPVWSNVVNPQF